MKKRYEKIFGTTSHFFQNLSHLIFSVPFLILTLLGNGLVSAFALMFYYLEHDINPKIHSVIDAFWWSFSTATTTGYGDITPVTPQGKFMGILLMLMGTATFATYTAFFSKAIIGEDFSIKPIKKEESDF